MHVVVVVVYHVTIVAIGHGHAIWVVEEMFAFRNRIGSTHCREFLYVKLCRHADFVRTTQLIPQPGHE